MRDKQTLGPWIRRFLMEHLPGERNLARNTQRSYRDAIRLLVIYASTSLHRKVDDLLISDIHAELLRKFLRSLLSGYKSNKINWLLKSPKSLSELDV